MVLLKNDKIKQKEEIKNLIKDSYSIVAWDYSKLDSFQVSNIKSIVSKTGSKDKVYKNRIIKKAFDELNKNEIGEDLVGQTSFLFIKNEESTALKDLFEYLKKIDKNNKRLKSGYISGEFFNKEEMLEIASLPSKNELIGRLLFVLEGNMRSLAVVLSKVSEKKEV